jgi:tetratricopeptide (TPR) repeat protein
MVVKLMKRTRFRSMTLLLLLLLVGGAYGAGHLWALRHYRMAREALAWWDFDSAEQHLGRCSQVWWFRTGEVRLLQARTARLAGNNDQAEALLRECRELGVPDESLELEHYLLRALQGELASVESALVSRVLEGHPETVAILEVLTPVYLKTYRLQSARECVNRWREKEPNRLQAWILSAQVNERLRAKDDTFASYRRVVELDPDNLPARLTLAGLLCDRQGPRPALAHFEYVRSRRGDTTEVLVGLARCRRLLNETEEARRLLEKALAEHPQNGPALAERSRLSLESESAAEAEKWFRRAVKVMPFEKDVLYGLYQCLEQLGNRQEAEEVLTRLQRIDADLERLADLTAQIARHPRSPALRCETGLILLRNGQQAEALRWLESALLEDPEHAGAHQALGEHYERIGNPERAVQHRQWALAGERAGR